MSGITSKVRNSETKAKGKKIRKKESQKSGFTAKNKVRTRGVEERIRKVREKRTKDKMVRRKVRKV
jgi:hypothetical protein